MDVESHIMNDLLADGFRREKSFFDIVVNAQIFQMQNHIIPDVSDRRIRHRSNQLARVFFLRMQKNLLCQAAFDNLPVIHDNHALTDFPDDSQVMGNKQNRAACHLVDLLQKAQDLCLYRHIECGCRLIADDQIRGIDDGHRDHDTLAHAAGKLMRIFLHQLTDVVETDLCQNIGDAPVDLLIVQVRVQAEHLADLPADLHNRVQGCHRFLENHGNLIALDFAALLAGNIQYLLSLQRDRGTRIDNGRLIQQAHHGQRGHRLAGAGLTDDTDNLPLAHLHVEVIDYCMQTLIGRKTDRQIFYFQKFFTHSEPPQSFMARRPSLIRLNPRIMITIMMPGNSAYHGALKICDCASESIRPRLGSGG